jgi:hypothetical protein
MAIFEQTELPKARERKLAQAHDVGSSTPVSAVLRKRDTPTT